MLSSGVRPLLAAKLLVPRSRPGAVARSRLHERLAVDGTRLTTVVAPAGWGKTTLLAGWAADPRPGRPVGWLSIDEVDDEPVRFWTYAISALDAVAPHLTRDALAALGAPGLDPLDVAISALLNALTGTTDRYVLVLDDYHLLSHPAIHESVEFLLAYLPPALHLVIAARADPPLPLARMRARGTLTEIRVEDLRCTPAEGAGLVAAVTGARIDTDGLVERTEGWPAGLQLAALAVRSAVDPVAAAATIRGDERHILDYFSAEVLVGLDADQRNLLVRGSVLERLSGPLCDALLGSDNSSAVLVGLDRADLFVTPIGDQWYRCHQLFRDVLRRELDATSPGIAESMLARAADWFLAQGRIEEAIAHRISAGDTSGAVELIRDHGRWFLDHGAMAALLQMAQQLASTVSDPRLYLALADAAILSGRPELCADWLRAAERLIADDSEPPPGWHSLRAMADATWAVYGIADDPDAALRHARRAVELEVDPALWGYVHARNSLASALVGAGRMTEGVTMFRQTWRLPASRELPTLLSLQAAGQVALGLVEVGSLDAARTVCAEVADSAAAAERAWGDGAAAAVTLLRLAQARLAAVRDPAGALPLLLRAVELAECWRQGTMIVWALTDLAAAQWGAGDRVAARTCLDRAEETCRDQPVRQIARLKLDELEARIGRRVTKRARERGVLTEELTDRELAVLRALRGPLSARQIGGELYLSINTVKGYTKSLYRKLGVVTRADAVRRGHELGLI